MSDLGDLDRPQQADDDADELRGADITPEQLDQDLSFDSDAAPDDDAMTDDDARTADLDPTEDDTTEG